MELKAVNMSPGEWALYMLEEDVYLDTIAMFAIRNMLGVNILE